MSCLNPIMQWTNIYTVIQWFSNFINDNHFSYSQTNSIWYLNDFEKSHIKHLHVNYTNVIMSIEDLAFDIIRS